VRTEDGYIISKCLNGNPAAFGLLVDKYKASIYAFVYSELHNFHDAEDVTQEVFIKAYQKLRKLRRWDNFLAWLYSIASNLCKTWIRSKSRRPDHEFIEDQETLNEPSINLYEEDPIFETLHEALDSLPDTYRQALTLHHLGGMNSNEIARFLGVSPTAIRHRLSRARQQLRKEMVSMMSETFEAKKLQAIFTFRVVEIVKGIKLSPMTPIKALPFGFSLAAGIMLLFFGMNLSFVNQTEFETSSTNQGEMKVLNVGEYPVDVLRMSNISVIAGTNGNGSGNIKPSLQNALFMAPQAEGGTWTRKADMPTARGALSASEVNGKIYAIGGFIQNQFIQPLSAVEEYDPITNRWTKKADMPTARNSFSTSVVDGKIYAIGGGGFAPDPLSIVEQYDPVADKWTRKSDMPTARSGLSTCTVNNKIYAIGGYLWDGKANTFAVVEEYDPKTDKWTTKTDMPTKRSSFTSFAGVVDGLIYVIGGWREGKGFLSLVEQYDPIADKWTTKTDMPTARVAGIATLNGKIYAIGGYSRDGNPNLFSTVEEYDPVSDSWTRKNDMPTTRTSLSACAANGKIYVIGGDVALNERSILTAIVEEYDPGAVKSIDFKGKLPTTWGNTKLTQSK